MKQYEYMLTKTKQMDLDDVTAKGRIHDHEECSESNQSSILTPVIVENFQKVGSLDLVEESNNIQYIGEEDNYVQFQNIDFIMNEMFEEENINERLFEFLKVFLI